MSLLVKDDSIEFPASYFDLLFGVVQFFFRCPIRLCHQENTIHEGNNAQCLPVLTDRWAI